MAGFRLTDFERETGVLLVHSDIYPSAEGWLWCCDRPDGWSASGKAATPGRCQDAVEEAVLAAAREGGEEITIDRRSGSVRITRIGP